MAAAKYSQGQWVWLLPQTKGKSKDPIHDLAIGAQVITVGAKSLQVVDDDKKKHDITDMSKVKPMDESSVHGVEDMILLGDLEESAVIRNLEQRFKQGNIYTYTGAILIAVNPYQVLPLYNSEQIEEYRDKKIGECPPHIFAIGDNAYSNMKRYQQNQCILISGESGAGKTENTKLLLQFLAAVSGQRSWIEQQIIESNPVLEAFGNAKTVRNNNSSRFGKYISIDFNEKGSIEGARLEQYLLEKSRLVYHQKDERNFHIFYCMLSGMSEDEKKQLDLSHAKDYHYLNQGGKMKMQDRDDAQDFAKIKSAMKVLLFSDEEIWSIFKILAALLHLGNLKYTGTHVNHSEASVIDDRSGIKRVVKSLLVAEDHLIHALTSNTLETRDGHLIRNLNRHAAVDVRDAFVKGVYGRLFIWIVNKINKTIDKCTPNGKVKRQCIGLLDIFGFENFGHNSFEQMCINYANENLQQFFVAHMFRLEQEAYLEDGILWDSVNYEDNREVLHLLVYDRLSVFTLVDEESKFPNGTDASLLHKLHKNHHRNALYVKPKSEAMLEFGINHFAGEVKYSTKGFLEKNRDSFSKDLLDMAGTSKSFLFKELFHADFKQSRTQKIPQTLAAQFRQSLDELMETLHSCKPFFVRCIKPNTNKKQKELDRALCLTQVHYSGMMETIKIRRNGYPIRHSFAYFVDRYRIIATGIKVSHSEKDCKAAARLICEEVLQNEDYQLGEKQIFLKDGQDAYLEQQRDRYHRKKVICIQKAMRGYLARTEFQKNKEQHKLYQETELYDEDNHAHTHHGKQKQEVNYFKPMVPQIEPATKRPFEPIPESSSVQQPKSLPRSVPIKSNVFDTNWRYSRRVIAEPLLKKTSAHHEYIMMACHCHEAILKYMGDIPHKPRSITELTDLIFEPPLTYEILRDEVYCQVMKQLTENRTSLMKGWELMWLMTGCFVPSQTLLAETDTFLRSRSREQRSFAKVCYERMYKTLGHGTSRKFPPHEVEVKAVQQQVVEMYYRVHFPDGSAEHFHVESNHKAKEIVEEIAAHLELRSYKGFSLFVKIADKVISVPNEDFVYDFGKHWVQKLKQQGTIDSEGDIQLIFMRKIWTNVRIGKDRNADIKFHYPQELPKYLRGYHQYTKEQSLKLAAYILRGRYGKQAKTQTIPSIIKELAPESAYTKVKPQQWHKPVTKLYNALRGKTAEDIKIEALEIMSTWETFGSAFFSVRQTSEPGLPMHVLLAINPNGVYIINAQTKIILDHEDYDNIIAWSSDATSFHMTTGNVMKSTKFLFETNLGFKIDDLLTSYKDIHAKKQPLARTVRRLSTYPAMEKVLKEKKQQLEQHAGIDKVRAQNGIAAVLPSVTEDEDEITQL